eukprot:g20952.t1
MIPPYFPFAPLAPKKDFQRIHLCKSCHFMTVRTGPSHVPPIIPILHKPPCVKSLIREKPYFNVKLQ